MAKSWIRTANCERARFPQRLTAGAAPATARGSDLAKKPGTFSL